MSRLAPTKRPDTAPPPDEAPSAEREVLPVSTEPVSTEPVSTVRRLARQIRTSKLLTPALKRYWLAVLPHLEPVDRLRLDAILRRDTPPE